MKPVLGRSHWWKKRGREEKLDEDFKEINILVLDALTVRECEESRKRQSQC